MFLVRMPDLSKRNFRIMHNVQFQTRLSMPLRMWDIPDPLLRKLGWVGLLSYLLLLKLDAPTPVLILDQLSVCK